MLQEIILLQKRAVDDLLQCLEDKDDITFKAPTGSGKTYMMADFMNRVLENDEDVVFLVSSLSKGELARQNFDKFNQYVNQGEFKQLRPYLISSEVSGEETLFIPTNYNVYILPRDLYKKDSRLMKGVMDNFLNNLTLNEFLGGQEKKVYLIKDECHQATNNLDNLSKDYFEKTINFSATPNLRRGQTPDVEITEDEAINAKLIKYVEWGQDDEGLEVAINKFEEIKGKYRDLLGVNPCLIIQISNKDKADYELNNVVFPTLSKNEHQDLKWMLIVDKDSQCDTNDVFKAKKLPVSKWKDYVKSSTAAIDIIIFKMVISEGWDIPRACMLYQLRDTDSNQLDEQVIGRVRRNPRLLDFEYLSDEAKHLAMTAWIWGVKPRNNKYYSVKLYEEPEDITNNVKIKTTVLKGLDKKIDFDIDKYLESCSNNIVSTNIFELGRKWSKANIEVKKLGINYSSDYSKWIIFTKNIDKIKKESEKVLCDYNESMVLATNDDGTIKEVSFVASSTYPDHGNYCNISDWVWKRNDGHDKFSFDSDAERQWANILNSLIALDNNVIPNARAIKKVRVGKINPMAGVINLFGEEEPDKINPSNKYLWGKNFLSNSEIKFEYYDSSILNSYPDFIMVDSFDRIHIFEVKSVNISSNMPTAFNQEDYLKKIDNLKRCYKQASIVTKQIFYLPILKNETWQITQFVNGNERLLTKEQFINFVINK